MYSSPLQPAGTGRSAVSSTYTWVLRIGAPRETGPPSAVTGAVIDQTVVSVGPYMLVTLAACAASGPASDCGNASPPVSTRTPANTSGLVSMSGCHRLGVACMTVMPSRSTSARRASGSSTSSRLASTTRAPTSSGWKISRTAMSKLTVVTASIRSSGPTGTARAIAARKLSIADRSRATPLGRPVEPEV